MESSIGEWTRISRGVDRAGVVDVAPSCPLSGSCPRPRTGEALLSTLASDTLSDCKERCDFLGPGSDHSFSHASPDRLWATLIRPNMTWVRRGEDTDY